MIDLILGAFASVGDWWAHLSFLERFGYAMLTAYFVWWLVTPVRKERP